MCGLGRKGRLSLVPEFLRRSRVGKDETFCVVLMVRSDEVWEKGGKLKSEEMLSVESRECMM